MEIYDDAFFRHQYLNLRSDKENYNDLFEQPAMMALTGDVSGKRILEIGCGYGASSIHFAREGAAAVFAFDVSREMIRMAEEQNAHPAIRYAVMNASELQQLEGEWDIAYSSLVMHYIEDLEAVFREICRLLVPSGIFVFSMEHPITTAGVKGCEDVFDEKGEHIFTRLDHYSVPGARHVVWLETEIEKYHHTVSGVVNSLIESGFVLERLEEPVPDEKYLETIRRMRSELQRPSYLMCRCRKAI